MSNIKKYVEDALKNANEILTGRNRKLSEYARGYAYGSMAAYRHVLIELSPVNDWKRPGCIFDAWVDEVCACSPLTTGDAIEIYMFYESTNIAMTDTLTGLVIELGLRGYARYDIMQIVKYEVEKEKAETKKHRWTRKVK